MAVTPAPLQAVGQLPLKKSGGSACLDHASLWSFCALDGVGAESPQRPRQMAKTVRFVVHIACVSGLPLLERSGRQFRAEGPDALTAM